MASETLDVYHSTSNLVLITQHSKMRKFDVLHDVNLMSSLFHSTTTPVSMIDHSISTPVRVGRCRRHISKCDFFRSEHFLVGGHPLAARVLYQITYCISYLTLSIHSPGYRVFDFFCRFLKTFFKNTLIIEGVTLHMSLY